MKSETPLIISKILTDLEPEKIGLLPIDNDCSEDFSLDVDSDLLPKYTYSLAYGYLKSALYLRNKLNEDPMFFQSAAVLSALSCELFIKSILYYRNILTLSEKKRKNHDLFFLYNLYKKLYENDKYEIANKLNLKLEEFECKLEKNKDVFDNVRYINEKNGVFFDSDFLVEFAVTLGYISKEII